MTDQFISMGELTEIQGVLASLNGNDSVFTTEHINFSVVAYDINGDRLGEIAFNRATSEYAFYLGDTNDQ